MVFYASLILFRFFYPAHFLPLLRIQARYLHPRLEYVSIFLRLCFGDSFFSSETPKYKQFISILRDRSLFLFLADLSLLFYLIGILFSI